MSEAPPIDYFSVPFWASKCVLHVLRLPKELPQIAKVVFWKLFEKCDDICFKNGPRNGYPKHRFWIFS